MLDIDYIHLCALIIGQPPWLVLTAVTWFALAEGDYRE
jgi:hypothetical protein